MRILYITDIDFSSSEASGVAKKIIGQCKGLEFWRENIEKVYLSGFLNYDTYAIKMENKTISQFEVKKTYFARNRMNNIYNELIDFITTKQIKFIYMRYIQMNIYLHRFIKMLYKLNVTTFVEVPTYPFRKERITTYNNRIKDKEYYVGFRYLARYIMEEYYIRSTKKYISRIITFSDDDYIWNIRTIRISNGINTFETQPRIYKPQEKAINLLLVANVSFWHGADRVIEGLREYLKYNPTYNVNFIIAGDGVEIPRLKEKVINYDICDNVLFVGKKTGEQLDDLYDEADLGISTLALHRKHTTKDSSLKTREYLAKGIPCVGTVYDTQILGSPLSKYYFIVPVDDSPINISELTKYIVNLREQNLTNEISKLSKQILDWSIQMKKVIDELKQLN